MKIIEIAGKLWELNTFVGIYYYIGTKKSLEKSLNITIEGKGVKNELSISDDKIIEWLTNPKNSKFLEQNTNENKKMNININKVKRKLKLEKISKNQ